MPIESPNYPSQEGPIKFYYFPASAVTLEIAANSARDVGRYVWDALGYLDVFEPRTRKILDNVIAIRDAVEALSAKVETLSAKMDALGVTIPNWETRTIVLNGSWDEMGLNWTPSAAQLGLRAEFDFIQNPDDQTPGLVFGIEPPAGTFVGRGSTVKITCNVE